MTRTVVIFLSPEVDAMIDGLLATGLYGDSRDDCATNLMLDQLKVVALRPPSGFSPDFGKTHTEAPPRPEPYPTPLSPAPLDPIARCEANCTSEKRAGSFPCHVFDCPHRADNEIPF